MERLRFINQDTQAVRDVEPRFADMDIVVADILGVMTKALARGRDLLQNPRPLQQASATVMPSTRVQKRPALGRPTREASEELIRRVLLVAQEEFIARGFDGASIEGIAQAAGTSKLTLYRHFESKHRLFMAVIEQLVDQYAVQLTGRIDTSLPPRQVLTDMGLFLANCYFTPEGVNLTRILIAELNRVDGLPEISARLADLARSPVERYLRLLQSRGEASFDDVRRAAIQFVNLCMLGQYYLLRNEEKSIPGAATRRKIVDSAVRLFAAGYLTCPPSDEPNPA